MKYEYGLDCLCHVSTYYIDGCLGRWALRPLIVEQSCTFFVLEIESTVMQLSRWLTAALGTYCT